MSAAQIFSYLYDFFLTICAINRELVEFIHTVCTYKWHLIYILTQGLTYVSRSPLKIQENFFRTHIHTHCVATYGFFVLL